MLSSDCPTDKACIRNKCKDPCPGVCGSNANCAVVNHVPTCTCFAGYVGDPFSFCRQPPPPPITEATVTDPCVPSPCGPNSVCRAINQQAVCSCQANYMGSPPNCRPECVVNAECPSNRACHRFKCTDPCPGTCGLGARCEVINHNPICSCSPGMTGDPFTRCYPVPRKLHLHKLPAHGLIPVFSATSTIKTSRPYQPLLSISMRTELRMPSCRRVTRLFVPKWIRRKSSELSTGVCCQYRLSVCSRVHFRKV